MIKFLHIADCHLNAGFASKKIVTREKLVMGLIESFENAIEYVISENLEGLIIAGDLFDHERISFQIESRVMKSLIKLCEHKKHIFYTTGNHDPMNAVTFFDELKQNAYFHIFNHSQVEIVTLVADDNTVYKVIACGHQTKNEQRNLIKSYPTKKDNNIWIGIAHASIPSAIKVAEEANYMPAALNDLLVLGYDYFALGHIHIRQKLTDKIAYAGNPQGLNIKEVGSKGGYIIECAKGYTKVTEINFNKYQWEQLEVCLDDKIDSFDQLRHLLYLKIGHHLGAIKIASNKVVIRITLTGKTPLKDALTEAHNLSYLSDEIKERFGLLDVELKCIGVTRVYDVSSFENEHTVLAKALSLTHHYSEDDIFLNKLMKLPIFASDMTKEEQERLILSYMPFVKNALVERMVKKDFEDQ